MLGLDVQGSSVAYGFGVTDNGYGLPQSAALFAQARGTNFGAGMTVVAENDTTGIFVEASNGTGNIGVSSLAAQVTDMDRDVTPTR